MTRAKDALYGADCASDTTCYAVGNGVVVTITQTVDETSLSRTPGTNRNGVPIRIGTLSDPDGIRTVQVCNSATNQKQASLAFDCSDAPSTVKFRVSAGTRYRVTVTDCNTPRVKTTFVIRPNGSVNRVNQV